MTNWMTQPGYVDARYLQTLADVLAPLKTRTYKLMHVAPDQFVLDVGCGIGSDTLGLAQIIGPQGQVIGVDSDPQMIAKANRHAAELGVDGWTCHYEADALSLPFEDGEFDACRSDRLFQNLDEPDRALAEMIRVTRPGGWVVVFDVDHSSITLDTAHTETEWIVRRARAEFYQNGAAGRRLYGQFVRAGLENVRLELHALPVYQYDLARYIARLDEVEPGIVKKGLLTREDLDTWHTEMREADEAGTFFAYGVMMIAVGQKPNK